MLRRSHAHWKKKTIRSPVHDSRIFRLQGYDPWKCEQLEVARELTFEEAVTKPNPCKSLGVRCQTSVWKRTQARARTHTHTQIQLFVFLNVSGRSGNICITTTTQKLESTDLSSHRNTSCRYMSYTWGARASLFRSWARSPSTLPCLQIPEESDYVHACKLHVCAWVRIYCVCVQYLCMYKPETLVCVVFVCVPASGFEVTHLEYCVGIGGEDVVCLALYSCPQSRDRWFWRASPSHIHTHNHPTHIQTHRQRIGIDIYTKRKWSISWRPHFLWLLFSTWIQGWIYSSILFKVYIQIRKHLRYTDE